MVVIKVLERIKSPKEDFLYLEAINVLLKSHVLEVTLHIGLISYFMLLDSQQYPFNLSEFQFKSDLQNYSAKTKKVIVRK